MTDLTLNISTAACSSPVKKVAKLDNTSTQGTHYYLLKEYFRFFYFQL